MLALFALVSSDSAIGSGALITRLLAALALTVAAFVFFLCGIFSGVALAMSTPAEPEKADTHPDVNSATADDTAAQQHPRE